MAERPAEVRLGPGAPPSGARLAGFPRKAAPEGSGHRAAPAMHRSPLARRPAGTGEVAMLDALFVLATVAFFVLSLAYVAGCDRL
ncbi:MAG TPA: hypothetical protein VMU15_06440 [Anaeromyxobacter sp.]|nr:hypothetical protein [Anaeromyxobacter sp.]